MDIKSINGLTRAYQEQINVSKDHKSKKSRTAQPKDEVVLSSRALEFSHTIKALKNSPEIREAKIKEISDKIADGSYKVSSDEIAESIITYSKYY